MTSADESGKKKRKRGKSELDEGVILARNAPLGMSGRGYQSNNDDLQ